jgi:hypothetical protein
MTHGEGWTGAIDWASRAGHQERFKRKYDFRISIEFGFWQDLAKFFKEIFPKFF